MSLRRTRPQDNKHDALFDITHLSQGLETRAVKGAGFSISSQVLNYGLQTVGTIILARLLVPEDFGLVAMVDTFSLVLQNFGFNGITEAVVQREDITHAQLTKLFWIYLGLVFALTAGFAGLSFGIVWFFKEPQLRNITWAMSFTILFSGFATCHMALMTRNMKFHVISAIQVISAFLSNVVAIVLAIDGFSYWALVLRRISMQFFIAVLVWALCRWRPGLPSRGERVAPLLGFAFRTYTTYLIDYVRKNIDKILIGKIFGKGPLGHYDRASQLSSMLPNQLAASLSGVGLAALSRLKGQRDKYLDSLSKALSAMAFIAFPGSVLLTLIGKDLILLVLGKQWNEAGVIFSALGPSVGVVVVYYSIYWLHFSLGRADRLLRWTVFTLIASLLSYAVGLFFGPIGVAAAYSILFYILLIPALYYAGRPLQIKASFFLKILWKYWLSAFAAGTACWLALALLESVIIPDEYLGLFMRIAAISFLFVLVYIGLILILFRGPRPLLLLLTILKRFFSKQPLTETPESREDRQGSA